jgi:hypothetical protein
MAYLAIQQSVGRSLIIQTIRLDPSGSDGIDEASNVSRLDPSGADQIDAEHPSRNRKVVGSAVALTMLVDLQARSRPVAACHRARRAGGEQGVWSSRPASKRRGAAPILTVAQDGWSLGRAVARPWRGEGRATLCGDPQAGDGQALVAPLLPSEPPHEWPINHPRPLQPLHLVLREVTLNGGRGRVTSHR